MSKKLKSYDLQAFGRRLKTLRRENNLSQEKLAEMLNLTVDSVYKLEAGKTNCMPDHLLRICELFDISADYLFLDYDMKISNERKKQLEAIYYLLSKCDDFDLNKVLQIIRIVLTKQE